MRNYLISNDGNEVVIDIKGCKKIDEYQAHFLIECDAEKKKTQHEVFVKRIGEFLFASFDQKNWFKWRENNILKSFTSGVQSYRLYRGFRPSGLSDGQESGLITQMPGKIVKVLVKSGDQVTIGQPLIILEAMKMENEIKSTKSGIIKEVFVKEDVIVEKGILILEFAE